MRTLFLQAPSFDGFDGGAGSRYQARREIASFWYPTWLAQPAALVENSKLIDAPPHKTSLAEVVAQANDFDLVIVHTSVPSFASDVKCIEALKAVTLQDFGPVYAALKGQDDLAIETILPSDQVFTRGTQAYAERGGRFAA